jgi:hypothetical protein
MAGRALGQARAIAGGSDPEPPSSVQLVFNRTA